MKNKIVLVVEDDSILAKRVIEELKESGFEVLLAEDGEAGLAMIEAEKPDLVLLDILLPKMDGITMLKQMKAKEWGISIPVIILSNLSDFETVNEAMEMGAYGYLVKSNWSLADLVAKVKEKLK